MGKSTISMAIFNSFLYVYQAGYPMINPWNSHGNHHGKSSIFNQVHPWSQRRWTMRFLCPWRMHRRGTRTGCEIRENGWMGINITLRGWDINLVFTALYIRWVSENKWNFSPIHWPKLRHKNLQRMPSLYVDTPVRQKLHRTDLNLLRRNLKAHLYTQMPHGAGRLIKIPKHHPNGAQYHTCRIWDTVYQKQNQETKITWETISNRIKKHPNQQNLWYDPCCS